MATAMLGMLPLSAVRGPRDELEQRLAGQDGDLWIEELKKFLRKEPAWKNLLMRLELGCYSNSELQKRLRNNSKVRLGRWVGVIADISIESRKTQVQLYKFTVGELCGGRASRCDVYAKAKEKGYDLCTPEAGLLLRERYTNQPVDGRYLEVAMEQIWDDAGDCRVFTLEHTEGLLMLSKHMGNFFSMVDILEADRELVFMRYK